MIADAMVPGRIPGGWIASMIVGIVGGWLGGLLLGSFGPVLSGVAIIPTMLGSALLIFGMAGISHTAAA